MSIQQLFFSGAATAKVTATGGTVYTDGNYKVHIFSSTGTFSVSQITDSNASLDVLVIGGGSIGNNGDGAYFDFDGKSGGDGGTGSLSRLYTGLTFGSYFGVANYTATVAAQNSSGSQLNNSTASPFIATSGQAAKQGGVAGTGAVYDSAIPACTGGATAGGTGQTGYTNTWGTTFVYGSGGGGGGGGATQGGSPCTTPGAGGSAGTGGGAGGSGGSNLGTGGAGSNATTYGSGGGGGGGAGSDEDSGTVINGGAGGNGSAGAIVIRYLFQ